MDRYPIPTEAVEKLKEHPYVLQATQWTVRFTAEFKKLAYEEYCRGKSMRKIFIEAGFDVEVLGDKRIQNFRNNLFEKAKDGTDFEDGRKGNFRKEAQSSEVQLAKRIKELEHRNAYLEQENEFLKKIQFAEKELKSKAGGLK